MKTLLYNLYDSDGILFAQERWSKTDNGYLVETKYCHGFDRNFIEAKPDQLHDRELISQE